MIEFEHLWAFLIAPLPLCIYLFSQAYYSKSSAIRVPFFKVIVDLSETSAKSGAVIRKIQFSRRFLLLVCWLLLISALAKPVFIGKVIHKEENARDLLLAIDLSGSMDEQDFIDEAGNEISRLDAVKYVISDFIDKRQSDRVALTVFGDAAFPQSTFTNDHDTLQKMLWELQPRMAGARTMIGDAIGLSIRLFQASEKEEKVVILLTDGNDTGSKMPVKNAAQIAKENNIRIYTIAMGNPETIGERALDIPLLEEISRLTEGRTFLALNREELADIYHQLDKIEPSLIIDISYRPKRDLFYIPITALMVLITLNFMQIIWSERKNA